MGEIRRDIPKVKLFCGIIFGDKSLADRAVAILVGKYGPADAVSQVLPFDKTDFYAEEMGPGLKRIFVSFRRLVRREIISRVKAATNRLELRLSRHSRARKINLDPGYLTEANVCLATTKDFQHRVYAGRGIWVENTLRFRRGAWEDWEWTYPDFRTEEYKRWFSELRAAYRAQLKG
jgi:hypothetical protein